MRKIDARKSKRLGAKPRSRRGFKGNKECSNVNSNVNSVQSLPQTNVNNVNSENAVNTTNSIRPPPSTSVTNDNSDETLQSQKLSIEEPTNQQGYPKTVKGKFRKLKNMSREKLKSSSLPKHKQLGCRRSLSKNFFCHTTSLKKASCYKLVSSDLIAKAIQSAAICSNCKKEKSKLQLFEKPKSRKGLCETLAFKCSECANVTEFQTSLKGKDIRAYDINIRSVYAAQTVGFGRAGLSKICGLLDLPQPVNKRPFHKIQKQIHIRAQNLTARLLQEASQRLKMEILKDEDFM